MKLFRLVWILGLLLPALATRADGPPTPGTTAPPSYQLQDLSLGGSTRTDKWLAMDYFNYAQSYYGYGNTVFDARNWTYAMRPNFPSAGSTAVFNKGLMPDDSIPYGYPATEGIYTLFTRTPFVLTESSPLAGLKTVAMQIYLTTGGDDTTAYGVNGDIYVQPVLNLVTSTGVLSLSAGISQLYKSNAADFDHSGGGVDDTFHIYENYRYYQWDLSSVTGTILSFDITFSTYEHVSLRSIQLDQSDAVNVIPEPAVIAAFLGVLALSVAGFRRRRRFLRFR